MTAIRSAMVLSAGLGLRMRPLTDSRPKPLVALQGRALLDHALDRLRAAGVARLVVNTHYKAEMIERHLVGQPDVRLSHEPDRLETGGGVCRALPLLGADPFFVVNSDAVWRDGAQPALDRLGAAWDSAKMDALLLLQPTGRAVGYAGAGDYDCSADGRILRRQKGVPADYVFAGVQVLHPRLFADAPEGAFSLNILFDRAQAEGRLHGLPHDGEWYHVGTPEDLIRAEQAMAAGTGP